MTQLLCILGATGSIGTQTLDVVRHFPGRFTVHSLAAGKNIALLATQIAEFHPEVVSIQDETDRPLLQEHLKRLGVQKLPEILCGEDALTALATGAADTIIVGVVGLIGLAPTLAALKAGKRVLTANKETFVAGGHLVQPFLSQMLPIDSEHSAIHQCLHANTSQATIQRLLLTASGGPFRTWSNEQMRHAALEDALKHPNWVMGKKITIDSATLMNKGLEVIEAHWLFGLPYDAIDVLIHPQSTVHSGVEFIDGSILFQLGATDMRGPIQYALLHPERLQTPFASCKMDLARLTTLNFELPDVDRFPCLKLAYEAGRLGGSATTVLNAADEMAVQLLLKRVLSLQDLPRVIERVLEKHQAEGISNTPTLDDIHQIDQWACIQVQALSQRQASPTLLPR